MKTLTYGTLPTREEFEAAFEANTCVASVAIANEHTFEFTNDPRVGTCALTCSELWREIMAAQSEYGGETVNCDPTTRAQQDAAGQWCSDVLGVLGFEWV